MLISLIILILSLYTFYHKDRVWLNVLDFKENWEKNPLEEIYLADDCKGDLSLLKGRWPGTVEGCDCSWSVNYGYDVF